jgi:NAD(P)-dependent dehydrogenase (short-subunit alcohol dehydrogenase family)
MNKLEGKIAVVTGGNSGIGLATAKLLRREGAKVAISGRDQDTLSSAKKEVGGDTLAIRSDVSNPADVDAFFSNVAQAFGKIDVLFANAGVAKFAPISNSPESLFDEVFDINVKGVFLTIQKALPHLNDGASIVLNTTFLNGPALPEPASILPARLPFARWPEPRRRSWWDAAYASMRSAPARLQRRSTAVSVFPKKLSTQWPAVSSPLFQ